MKKVVLVVLAMFAFGLANAQEWNWGSTPQKAQQKWDELKLLEAQKKYAEAQGPCSWLLANTPDLCENLYIKGSKVYEALVKEESSKPKADRDKELLSALQDTALSLYDKRIKYFGKEAYVLDRKGKVAYKYLGSKSSELAGLHELYQKIIDLNGVKCKTINLTYYTRVIVKEYKKEMITKEETLNKYLELKEIVETQKTNAASKGESTEKIQKNLDAMESNFSGNVELNCNDAHTAYEEDFKASPSVKLANNIYAIMADGSCTDDSLYVQSVRYLAKNAPKAIYFEVLAVISYNKSEYQKSYNYYQSSIAYLDDSSDIADTYYEMAALNYSLNKYSAAREDANKSLAYNPSLSKNYKLIGNMYLNSYDRCSSDDIVQSRAVFIAAYNAYMAGGYTESAATAKAQFPSTEELFMTSRSAGDVISVGCWIGGTVTLKTR